MTASGVREVPHRAEAQWHSNVIGIGDRLLDDINAEVRLCSSPPIPAVNLQLANGTALHFVEEFPGRLALGAIGPGLRRRQ